MIKTPVFDGHNDLLLALWRSNDLDGKDFIFGRQKGHIDLPRCKKGGLKGGFFAIFVPATNVAPEAFWERHPDLVKNKKGATEKMPSNNLLNTEQISQTYAYEATIEMINIAHNIADQNPDKLEICTDYATLRSCIDKEKIALLLHIEVQRQSAQT